MEKTPNFKIGTIAAVLGISKRRLRQLVSEGMPREARGQYDLSACVQWFAKYKTALASRSSKLDQARLRKALAEAKLAEIQVTAMAEKLIPADVVQDTWKKITETIRARLLDIPAEIAAELKGVESKAEAQEIVKNQLYAAMTKLSQKDLVDISKSGP